MLFSLPTFILFLVSYLPWEWHNAEDVKAVVPANQRKSIAIIGAGSAGLAALKTAVDISEQDQLNWNIVLFDEREDVGGVWFPDARNPLPPPPTLPETPLYPRLRTNTPIPFMTYPHFVFPPGTPLYPHHDHIHKYHQSYADVNDLWPRIRFNHSVLNAEWISSDAVALTRGTAEEAVVAMIRGRTGARGTSERGTEEVQNRGRWNITFQVIDPVRVGDGRSVGVPRTEFFDHLVVASGNHHIPRIVHWKGEHEWLARGQGREIIHSVWYRFPESYSGKRVVVVGAGASGRDIASQVVEFADKMYLSVRHPVPYPIPGAELCAEISHFSKDAIHLVDGTTFRDVDIVLLGTGYQIRQPFLESSGVAKIDPTADSSAFRSSNHLTSNTKYLFPLHKHVFAVLNGLPVTALAFIGLPTNLANCPSDAAQSLFAFHLIKHGDGALPGKAELLRVLDEQEEEVRRKGFDPYTQGHRMIQGTENDYQDDLVEFLKKKGFVRDDGRPFVESWRRAVSDYQYLRRGWLRIEELGVGEDWLRGVVTEDQWADLMKRVNDWQRKWELANNLEFELDKYLL